MKIQFFSTRQVADRLGIRTDRLSQLVYRRSIKEPARSPCGYFLWTEKDLEAARQRLSEMGRYAKTS